MDLGEELNFFIKCVKRMTLFLTVGQNIILNHKLEYDYGLNSFTVPATAQGGRVGEWGTFEWSDGTETTSGGVYNVNDGDAVAGTDIFEWAGSVNIRAIDFAGRGCGQYIKLGVSLGTNSGQIALQQINLYAKIGRLAT